MKIILSILFTGVLIFINTLLIKAQPNNEWNNKPEVFEINRLPAHATLIPYANIQEALSADRTSSPFYFSLSGTWKFKLVTNPSERDTDFYKDNADVNSWQHSSAR